MKTLMIQGTSSHAGKSIITAGLLRVLKRRGINCAPFKPQNMALNSFVTMDGYEIGRAQAMQAESAKILPSVHMNPILLKPTSDSKAQVVLLGKPYKNLSAKEYIKEKRFLKKYAIESFEYLKKTFDVVIVEGAGSPAEINLRKNDIANMGFASIFDIPVLIVGDIDRGGVYASFYGTYALLAKREKKLVKGFIINKFRGDSSLLASANDFIEKKTGVPVIGIVPYFTDIKISEEDGVALNNCKKIEKEGLAIKIGVIKLPRISNFTDFEPLQMEEDVSLKYIDNPEEVNDYDIIIIPGSKNTIEDLAFVKKRGFEEKLKDFVKKGGELIGICGGYQMLGRKIFDPYGIESDIRMIDGLGYLPFETTLEREKKLKQVEFETVDGFFKNMFGYEIHMGVSRADDGERLFFIRDSGNFDGVRSKEFNVWGSYIHGLFDNDEYRLYILNRVRERKGLTKKSQTFNYLKFKDESYDKLADVVENSVNIDYIFKILGI